MKTFTWIAAFSLLGVTPALAQAVAPPAIAQLQQAPALARNAISLDLPSQRPPTAADNSTLGYKVGDIWSYSGKVWQEIQDGTWAPVNIGQARPLDLAPTAVGAYGTVLLNTAYTGADLILTRGSDSTTKTVGFVNSAVDAVSADAFCSANNDMALGTCYVTTLYDQSGNANNGTAPAGVSAPLWTTNTVGGLRAITFNSVASGASLNARWLTVPTTASFTQMNASVFAIAQSRSTVMTGVFATVGTTVFYNAASVLTKTGVTINAGTGSAPVAGQSGPAVTLMSQNLGIAGYYQGNSVQTGVVTGQPTTVVTGATLGGSTTGTTATMDAVALVLYNRTLTASDIIELRASGELILHSAPQTQDIWVADGDSITNGFGSVFLQGYPRQGGDLFSRQVNRYNVAVYGTTLTAHMAVFNAYVVPTYQANARNFVVSVAICTNDISGGATGATCYANLKTYVAQLKALGPNVRVIVSTLLPRGGTYPTEETNFNNLVRGGWSSFADGLADLAADPTMGNPVNAVTGTYFVDGLHPTDLGYTYLAPIMTKAVSSLLK